MHDLQPIAIVGAGAILPDAPDPQTFWQNIRTGWSSIREVPPGRWDPRLYYDPDPNAPDKTYSKIGAWVQGFKLEPQKLGLAIPPKIIAEMEEAQQWSIAACHQALVDYGYPRRQLEPTRVAVILGNLMAGEKHYLTGMRIRLPEFVTALESSTAFRNLPKDTQKALIDGMRDNIHARIASITEDTLPGELANVIAGRVANLFNFTGPNYIVDAACATALAAIQSAVQGLNSNQYDAVLTGGIDRNMGPDGFVKFCKIGALSPDGSRPFAAGANGFVMGEGAVVFLLKRLVDAERDGDRIYAVIRGIGGSSDGKGKGITAPNPLGQMRAIERAWKNAGISPETATLIEAHGTSTRVGDVVEAGSLNTLFSPFGLPVGKIALGSVKSNLGHLKGAAGAVALLKTIYALHDRILPPSLNFEQPNPDIDFAHSPLRVNNITRPWEMEAGMVRRAGISSFGFGGTNFHMVVEEYIPGLLTSTDHPFPVSTSLKEAIASSAQPELLPIEKASLEVSAPPVKEPARIKARDASSSQEKRGLLFLSAATPEELRQALVDVISTVNQGSLVETPLPTMEDSINPERLAVDYGDRDDLLKRAEKTLKAMEMDSASAWQSLAGQGIYRGHGQPGKIAFLFPGQGSQYANMLRDLRDQQPVVEEVFAQADEVMFPILGRTLTSYIYCENDAASVKAAEEALKDTTITQPAVLTADVAILKLLEQSGFKPDLVAGHSLGEYAALVAAGVLSFPEALQVVSNRGRAMAAVSLDDNGCMAAVSAPLPEVERILKSIEGYVVIANINSPLQSVIGGATPAIDAALAAFDSAGYQAVKIPVSHAFHTRIVAPASQPLRDTIARMDIHQPSIPVIANVTGQVYPETRDEILDILAHQVASPVQFVRSMNTLYAEGARIFVEIGPKRVITALTVDNYRDRSDVTILATNHPRKGGPTSFNEALAGLYAAGVVPQLAAEPAGDHSLPPELITPKPELEPAKVLTEAKVQAVPTPEPAADEDGVIQAFILKEVSERTGYPQEMLELDLDLEGDLGIDTVKQAELFLTMREHFQIPRPEELRLSDYNTLAKVIAFARQGVSSLKKEDAGPGMSEQSPTKSAIRRRIPSTILKPRPELCLGTGIILAAGTKVLVVSGHHPLDQALVHSLQEHQVEVEILPSDIPDFDDRVASIASAGSFDGVYFLPSFDSEPALEILSPQDWQKELDWRIYHIFTLFQQLQGKPFLVCATAMSGLHGFGEGDPGVALSAGVRGFAKALARERSGTLVKVVDFDPQEDAASIADYLIKETLFDPSEVEIGYHQGLRFGIGLKDRPLTAGSGSSLPENSVYLVSGGTGGITGRVVLDFAHSARGIFYLMGRSALPDLSDPLVARIRQDRDGLRKEWLHTPSEDGSQPAPAVVEAHLARLERAASTLEIIHQVEASGSQVHYLPCEITDFQAVRQAVQKVLDDEGHVDVLLHAAGFESSRKLENKTSHEIHQTLNIKAGGFFYLVKAMEDLHTLPKKVVGFASVAGRFGNMGQADYSAANDLLTRLIQRLQVLHPDIQALCIDWGPWAEVGMASRGHIPGLMKMAGVETLLPANAAPLVRHELLSGQRGEILLANSLGAEESHLNLSGGLDLEKAAGLLHADHTASLLGQLTGYKDGESFDLQVVLDPKKEPFLADHMINGIPVLPAAIGIEGFLEAGRLLDSLFCPDSISWQFAQMEEVNFLAPAKFYRDQPHTLVWKVQFQPHKTGLQASISLESDIDRHNHSPEHFQHFTARLLLDSHQESPAGSNSLKTAWNRNQVLPAEEIYRLYFHGPAFQVLNAVSCSQDVLQGRLNMSRPAMSAGLPGPITVPALVELVMQTAAAWEIGKSGTLSLPSSIARITLLDWRTIQNPQSEIPSEILAEVTPRVLPDGRITFDGKVVNGSGRLFLSVEGYRTSPLPYSAEEAHLKPFRKLVSS